jgi:hypothetical protein
MLLHEGTHTFTSQVKEGGKEEEWKESANNLIQVLTFHGVKDVNESPIVHGTITRYRVRNGEIGLAWEENKPVFIDKPDIYEVPPPLLSLSSLLR